MRFMSSKTGRILACLCLMATVIAFTQVSTANNLDSDAEVKNVILLISDGAGFNTFIAIDYYQYGETGRQVYEYFPTQVAMSTNNINSVYDTQLAWSDFGYLASTATDSAAAATAMATGFKTTDGSIGVDISGEPLTNIVEYAEQLGKTTGVVTSVQFSHATPAGFVAHNPSRSNYDEIATEMLKSSAVDVIMGCGSPDYGFAGEPASWPSTQYVGGDELWAEIQTGSVAGADANNDGVDDAWQVIRDRGDFQDLAVGDTPSRVLGLAKNNQTLQAYRTYGAPSLEPFTDPFIETVPTLSEMTEAALNILDNDEDGFFLMVEGGAVDWANHSGWLGYATEEQIDFNNTVKAVVNWVQKNSNWGETLVIVTADHETGLIWGPGSNPEFIPIVNNGAGVMPEVVYHSGYHSNSLVPLFAKGDTARLFKGHADEMDIVRGPYIDNTEIAEVIFQCLK